MSPPKHRYYLVQVDEDGRLHLKNSFLQPKEDLMNSKSSAPQKSITWAPIDTFKDDQTGFAVVLSKSDSFRPRFSIQIVRITDAPRPSSHLGIFVRSENGKVHMRRVSTIIEPLLKAAEDRAIELAQAREDEIMEEKIEREKREMNRGKPVVRPGLKRMSKTLKEAKEGGGEP